jgi:SAM-dependent methyltransferase
MANERFEFGKNWASFSELVDDERLASAEKRLVSLLGCADLSGRRFLDIGCGSGLHALAALRLGAKEVVAIDIDPHSVSTARALLARYWSGDNVSVRQQSVFELQTDAPGEFDVVYSWGVLHHTGDMARAIRIAAQQMHPDGVLALALYGRTRYCGLWTRIKRWYVGATPEGKAAAEKLYVWLFGLYLLLRGKRLRDHIATYNRKRGMDFLHDVRDWIGGYPYESISPGELAALLAPLDFEIAVQNVKRRSGLFGSGNDEYLLRKICAASSR